jgi:hydroxypyruvate reductase
VESLILSDVVGDDPAVIGSGPTVPDPTTFAEVLDILDRLHLRNQVPESVVRRLEDGCHGRVPETPKPGDAIFGRVKNVIVGNNRAALSSAAEKARSLGFEPLMLAAEVEGEARETARFHAAIARECVLHETPIPPPACLISGGETTVTVSGSGLGGRNQEFVLSAALDLSGIENIAILSAGTDGIDGPTDAAGAIADGETVKRNPAAQDYLRRNDSYHYFESLGDLVVTGPTGTNVMDVRIFLIGGQSAASLDPSADTLAHEMTPSTNDRHDMERAGDASALTQFFNLGR